MRKQACTYLDDLGRCDRLVDLVVLLAGPPIVPRWEPDVPCEGGGQGFCRAVPDSCKDGRERPLLRPGQRHCPTHPALRHVLHRGLAHCVREPSGEGRSGQSGRLRPRIGSFTAPQDCVHGGQSGRYLRVTEPRSHPALRRSRHGDARLW